MIPATYNGYVIDESNALLVSRQGEGKKLRNKTFHVLMVLVRSESRLVSKEEIIRQVWPDTIVTDDSLVQCIREIRRALGVSRREVLITRSRLGYELHPDAKEVRPRGSTTSTTSDDLSDISVTDGAEAAAPETTAPETTAPETTVPETTVPETTAPETSCTDNSSPEQRWYADDESASVQTEYRAPSLTRSVARNKPWREAGPDSVSTDRESTGGVSAGDQLTGHGTTKYPYRSLLSVGRDMELEEIAQWLHANCGNNENGLLVVSGDPGVGKTHLLDEIRAREVVVSNWLVCSSLCFEVSSELAYSTLANWLRTPDVNRNIWMLSAAQQAAISKILPELNYADSSLPGAEGGLERYNLLQLYEAVLSAFQLSAKPLLFVIDNLQWCDKESLGWIEFLKCRKSVPTHAIVCASRAVDSSIGRSVLNLLQLFRTENRSREIRLEPLSAIDSEKLLWSLLPSEIGTQTVADAISVARGLPLHLCEIARCTTLGDAQVTLDQGLRHFIELRLKPLTDEDSSLLNTAAVYGSSFTVDMLAGMLEKTEDRVLEILEHLWALAFVDAVDSGSYAIHDLVREHIYDRLTPVARSRLHLKVAGYLKNEVLAGNTEGFMPLARHYQCAGMIDKAARCYQQAAMYLRQSFASAAEAGELQRALDCLDKLPRTGPTNKSKVEVLLDLGLALSRDNGWGAKAIGKVWKEAYVLSRTIDDDTLKARAINTYDTYLRDNGQWHQCASVGADAYAMRTRLDDPYLRQSIASSRAALLLHTGYLREALSLYDGIIGDTKLSKIKASYNWFNTSHRIGAFFRSAQCLWLMGDTEEGERRCQQALELSSQSGNPFHQAITLFHVCLYYEFDQNHDQVLEHAQSLLDISNTYRFNYYTGSAKLYMAFARLMCCGDKASALSEAEEIQRITEAQHQRGTRMFDAYWFANLATAKLLTGDAKAAYQIAESTLARSSLTKNTFWDGELHRICGDALYLTHDSAGDTDIERAVDKSNVVDVSAAYSSHFQRAADIAQRQGANSLLQRLNTERLRQSSSRKSRFRVYSGRSAAGH